MLSIIPWSYNLSSFFESINRSTLSNSNWLILDFRVSIISSFFVFICFNSSRSCLSFSISKYFLFLLPCKMLENLPFPSISLWAIENTYLTTFLYFWINYKTQYHLHLHPLFNDQHLIVLLDCLHLEGLELIWHQCVHYRSVRTFLTQVSNPARIQQFVWSFELWKVWLNVNLRLGEVNDVYNSQSG